MALAHRPVIQGQAHRSAKRRKAIGPEQKFGRNLRHATGIKHGRPGQFEFSAGQVYVTLPHWTSPRSRNRHRREAICADRARGCERVGGMVKCVAMCEACAESCRKMAAWFVAAEFVRPSSPVSMGTVCIDCGEESAASSSGCLSKTRIEFAALTGFGRQDLVSFLN